MNTLLSVFNITNTYCFLLDKRIEFWKELKQSFSHLGLTVQPFIMGNGKTNLEYSYIDNDEKPPKFNISTTYQTWHDKPAAYNMWKSQRIVLEKTLKDGLDHILLIEDDSFIENDFQEILDKTAEFWKEHQWDIVYFGAYLQENQWMKTTNEHVLRVGHCGGFHGVLLTKPIIEKLLEFQPISPFDEICGKYINRYINAYCFYPSTISQKSGYSFIEDGYLNKPNRNNLK